ncbi:CBS domain-containing protein [Roseiconus nitratireducens]|uniref:CBS domain-containing protein n=1 Tax=Roseiconus nitratireducens TaxID=2605748 RepID=A0A5M6CWY8_9BACT|nr:CBS domain-containing protein [Roseiconus nitratireducens]KAA5539738.1 CBS domain-containing protein [Roseiconus nitratireducens]
MSVGRICTREVDLAETGESVQDAANRMGERRVGSLVVIDDDRSPVGIVTDRDIAIRVAGRGLDPAMTEVAAIMTELPESVREDTPIETAIRIMRSGPYRRLPVVDDQEHLLGLITLDDVLDLLCEEFEEIGELLRKEGPR